MLTGTRQTSNSSPLKKGSMTMFNRPANISGQDSRLEKRSSVRLVLTTAHLVLESNTWRFDFWFPLGKTRPVQIRSKWDKRWRKGRIQVLKLEDGRARLRDGGRFTLSIVLTYSENTDQYSLSPPKDLRMKKAPDIRSISPTNFIPIKSAGETRTFHLIANLLAMFVVLNHRTPHTARYP